MQPLLESRNQFCRHELDCDFSRSHINPFISVEIPKLSENTMKSSAGKKCDMMKMIEL